MANKKLNNIKENLKCNENKNSLIPNTSNSMASDKTDMPLLDEDKIMLVSDTFSQVEMFLHSDEKLGYVRLCAPGLYSFELPEQGADNCDCVTKNEEDDHLTDPWTKDDCLIELNLINEQEEAQLGVLQRDEVTGEMFMLMPMAVDMLLQPDQNVTVDDLSNEGLTILSKKTNDSSPATTIPWHANIVNVNVDDEAASQKTLTEFPENEEPASSEQETEAEADQEINERQLCSIVVPKMSLTFDLQLETGSLFVGDDDGDDDIELNEI